MKLKSTFYSLIVGALLLLSSCNEKKEAGVIAKTTFVKVEQVAQNYDQNKLSFNGKLKEKSLISLSFRVGGPLVELSVQQGDYVVKGQVIAVVDKRDYEIQVATRKAQLEQLQGEYDRYKALHEKNKIPANSFEKIKSGYLMAKAGYESALNQLNDTQLKSPISGYVHAKFTENFQTIGPGQPIISVIDVSSLEVIIAVPENQIAKISSSNQNLLNVKNANIKNQTIKLVSIGEKPEKDGLYQVTFDFQKDKNMNVLPGMSADVNMLFANNENTINIPTSAIFVHDADNCVWLYNEKTGTVSKRKIQIVNFDSFGKIKVLEGLKIGDKIVTAGVYNINEGQKVEPIKLPSSTNIGGLL